MSAEPSVLVHHSPDELAQAVCARLITTLVDVQSAGRIPHWVLTGGGIADRIHRAVAESPARGAVDWSRVEAWWGDERFVPRGDPDRNETQVRAALLDHIAVDPDRVHHMAASDEVDDDPDRAAEDYAAELRRAAAPEDRDGVPTFDVLMLGMGPDGHVASLFPERPALYEEERTAVAVRQSPKPPPTRVSLTMPVLNRAREVWLVVAGDDKAKAARLALGGAGVIQVPAAGPRGLQRTIWFLDRAAASDLPTGLTRIASP
ncbi:MAG TPA: 6-phosphogluconolactonase [Nocardioidaceae bacterium]|nr:6-phosphogluconolactonase [Nocardioidaceae bacterium]